MLEVQNLSRQFKKNGETVNAVIDMTFQAEAGELIVIHGPSGSGKSTLLLMAGGMMRPTGGSVFFNGKNIYKLPIPSRNNYRKREVGFIFQKFYLMPYLSVFDNVRLPLALRGDQSNLKDRIGQVADRLQLGHRLQHRPSQLSVGEQQRVAMARLLVSETPLILADEPTGNLDRVNCDIIADCMQAERDKGRVILLATHEERLIELGTRRIHIEAGRITEDIRATPLA
ncbi:MAG: ABC transporter ATP-binding protein [Candidatus Sumerlaeia bacterium]